MIRSLLLTFLTLIVTQGLFVGQAFSTAFLKPAQSDLILIYDSPVHFASLEGVRESLRILKQQYREAKKNLPDNPESKKILRSIKKQISELEDNLRDAEREERIAQKREKSKNQSENTNDNNEQPQPDNSTSENEQNNQATNDQRSNETSDENEKINKSLKEFDEQYKKQKKSLQNDPMKRADLRKLKKQKNEIQRQLRNKQRRERQELQSSSNSNPDIGDALVQQQEKSASQTKPKRSVRQKKESSSLSQQNSPTGNSQENVVRQLKALDDAYQVAKQQAGSDPVKRKQLLRIRKSKNSLEREFLRQQKLDGLRPNLTKNQKARNEEFILEPTRSPRQKKLAKHKAQIAAWKKRQFQRQTDNQPQSQTPPSASKKNQDSRTADELAFQLQVLDERYKLAERELAGDSKKRSKLRKLDQEKRALQREYRKSLASGEIQDVTPKKSKPIQIENLPRPPKKIISTTNVKPKSVEAPPNLVIATPKQTKVFNSIDDAWIQHPKYPGVVYIDTDDGDRIYKPKKSANWFERRFVDVNNLPVGAKEIIKNPKKETNRFVVQARKKLSSSYLAELRSIINEEQRKFDPLTASRFKWEATSFAFGLTGIGEIPSAIIDSSIALDHLLQGEWGDAALSTSSVIPVLGWGVFAAKYGDEVAKRIASIGKSGGKAGESVTRFYRLGDLVFDDPNIRVSYAQKSYSETFSADGAQIHTGKTGRAIVNIDELSLAIQSGKLSPRDVPVNFVRRRNVIYIYDTRTSQALVRAGVPQNNWYVKDVTGDEIFEKGLDEHFARNGMVDGDIVQSMISSGR